MNAAAVSETDLQRLLAGLAPARPRAIRTQAAHAPVPGDVDMYFREDEGITVIVETDETAGEPLWARITLRIHSSLEAVGMLAAIARTLAARGIPCNAVSAYYHDHLYVPWARRDEAIRALGELSKGMAT
jgi:uncharacterized protein